MKLSDPPEARPSLRERKKQKTRETIVDAAFELFLKKGYEHTTIAEIADAALVSPRTVSTYFAGKEDILFADRPGVRQRFARALAERPEGVTALDALRPIIATSLELGPHEMLRPRIVAQDESLRRSERGRMAPFEQIIVEAIAKDLDAGPDDVRARIAAAALLAAFSTIRERDVATSSEAFSPEQTMAMADNVIAFVRAGLQAFKPN